MSTRLRSLGPISVVLSLGLGACSSDTVPVGGDGVLLVVPAESDALGERLLEATASYLEAVTGQPPRIRHLDADSFVDIQRAAASERAGLVIALDGDVLAPDLIDEARMAGLGRWGFALETRDDGDWQNRLGSGGATFVVAGAASALARQYAAYEVLRRLGLRFYHPEQEYVPRHALDDLRDLARTPTALHREGSDYLPDFGWRSWSFHGSHPLEHLEAFSDAAHPIDEAVAVNDWIVKNRGNLFKGAGRGVAPEPRRRQRIAELEELRKLLGFPRGAGITLHNQQQGASADIDPASGVPVQQQIEKLVDLQLDAAPDAEWFGIHFGPTEFTVTPDEQTVQWIDWAGQHVLERRPDIEVEVNVHITGSQPTPNYGDLGCPPQTNDEGRGDYYDLAFHTDPRLGAKVHTVMFYPLEGPALVYNQETFAHKLCLMNQASAQGRPLTWFPEGSWWLSFDNPIPVYLPLYIWARGRDVELLRPLLASRGGGTLAGHRMFNSGQEWGYWQQDYAVGLWHWNADVTMQQVLGELFDPLCEPADWRTGCEARTTAIEVLTQVMEHQRELFLERPDFRGDPGGLYSYFAGEDDADVIAAKSGFEFRPVRVGFGDVMRFNDEELALFRETDLAALAQAEAFYAEARTRLLGVRDQVPEAGLPWIDEVIDGVEIDELRAAQAHALYEAVVSMREAERGGEADPAAAAQGLWQRAEQVLAQAEVVIRRREAAYRYPAAQTHGGGLTPDTAVQNGTTYPYRVHTKTHLLTYWHNRHDQVRIVIEGGELGDAEAVRLTEAIDVPGAALSITWPALDDLGGSITIGAAGTFSPGDETVDLGADEGWWPVTGELTTEGRTIDVVGGVARAQVRAETPAAAVELLEPADPTAQGVLGSVFPSLQWAYLPSPDAIVVAPDPDEDGSVAFDAVVLAPAAEHTGPSIVTEPITLAIPVALSSGGEPLLIGLPQTTITAELDAGALLSPIELDGRIRVEDLVFALQELAGFDEQGALQTLSEILDFDPADPPATVDYRANVDVTPK